MGVPEECEIPVGTDEEALQIPGGCRFLKEFPIEEPNRDEVVLTMGEGTSGVQKMVTGKNIFRT